MNLLPHIELNPSNEAKASVIWLHGLGASGDDFAPIVPQLSLHDELPVRFIFPQAPEIPVTINGGYIMPAWYDVLELLPQRKVNLQQLKESVEAIHQFIANEINRGISSDKIIIAGFSQGGAVAYHAALTYGKPLAGLLALSTYYVESDSFPVNSESSNLSVEIHHGSFDPMVPESMGKDAEKALMQLGLEPNYQSFPMEHEVCFAQISKISAWIQGVLSV